MDVPFPGGWRYAAGAVGGWILFLLALTAAAIGRARGWPPQLVTALALAPAAIAAAQFLIAYRVVSGADEFVRTLFARRMLLACALTVLAAVGWSGAELAGAPHLPAWLLYPLVWGLFGAATPLVRGSRA